MPSRPIEIRLGGYGPATTTFSRALKLIGDRVKAALGDSVEIRTIWNIMDFGYKSEDILWLVESGVLTLGYQSTSYFTDRVPDLGLLDLPFLFATREAARTAMDGRLGEVLAGRIEAGMNHRILGYFENGFRHISNRLRPVHRPADLAGMTIRVLPSDIQVRTFELLGAVPLRMDLTEAIERIRAGTIDAQENPLANTVTYGVHKFHRFHSLTSHFYLSRLPAPAVLRRLAGRAQGRHGRGRAGGRGAPAGARDLGGRESLGGDQARRMRGARARRRRACGLRCGGAARSRRSAQALRAGAAVARPLSLAVSDRVEIP
ncbi:MAG: TRAP transporter substrate-binding protein [Stellaceae bacterium]